MDGLAMEFLSSITPPYDIVPVHHAIYLGLAPNPPQGKACQVSLPEIRAS